MISEHNLLEEYSEGWHFPYRAKKAHYIKDNKSLCGNYTFKETPVLLGGGLYDSECCQKCLELKND